MPSDVTDFPCGGLAQRLYGETEEFLNYFFTFFVTFEKNMHHVGRNDFSPMALVCSGSPHQIFIFLSQGT